MKGDQTAAISWLINRIKRGGIAGPFGDDQPIPGMSEMPVLLS